MESNQISTNSQLSTGVNSPYQAQKDGDYVIDVTTGAALASQRALSKILDIPETSLRRKLSARHENNVSNGLEEILFIDADVKSFSTNSFYCAKLFPASSVLLLAECYKPELAKQISIAGAGMYLLHKAGYQAQLISPEVKVEEPQRVMSNVEWAKAYILQETQKINLEQYPGMKKMVNFLQIENHSQDESDFPPFSIFAYLVEENLIEYLNPKQIHILNRRVASLYRVATQTHPKRKTCIVSGKRANHYQDCHLVLIEQALDTLDI